MLSSCILACAWSLLEGQIVSLLEYQTLQGSKVAISTISID
jgi:hypothetical protein